MSNDKKAIIAVFRHQMRSRTKIAINEASHIGNVIAHIGAILLERGDIHPAHALVRNNIATIRVTIKTVTPNIFAIKLFGLGAENRLSFTATVIIV